MREHAAPARRRRAHAAAASARASPNARRSATPAASRATRIGRDLALRPARQARHLVQRQHQRDAGIEQRHDRDDLADALPIPCRRAAGRQQRATRRWRRRAGTPQTSSASVIRRTRACRVRAGARAAGSTSPAAPTRRRTSVSAPRAAASPGRHGRPAADCSSKGSASSGVAVNPKDSSAEGSSRPGASAPALGRLRELATATRPCAPRAVASEARRRQIR